MVHCEELKPNTQAFNNRKNFWLALALFAIPLSGLSIDIYVPSLPAVSYYFGVDKAYAQLSVSLYMLGIGGMQLFAGGISDSFGRKKPFLVAMLIFIGITFLIPFVENIYQLLLLRFLQGIFVAVFIVPMRSIVSDLFQGDEFLKKNTYVFLTWSLGPIVAPAIGGYLQKTFCWQADFYFLGIYSIFAFVMIALFLPETSLNRHTFDLPSIWSRYKTMLTTKEYLLGLLTNGLIYSLIILFAVVGPFLVQTILHYSANQFGHLALLTGLAWFVGGMINRFLLQYSYLKKSLLAFSSMLLISIIGCISNIIWGINLYSIVIPIILLLLTGGMVFSTNFARSITLFPKTSASANALFGSSVFLFGGIASCIGAFLKSTTAVPLSTTYIVIIILCFLVRIFNQKSEI